VQYYIVCEPKCIFKCVVIFQHLLEKIYDGIKSQDQQLPSLQLLLHVVCREPLWVKKIINTSVLKVVIKTLKVSFIMCNFAVLLYEHTELLFMKRWFTVFFHRDVFCGL